MRRRILNLLTLLSLLLCVAVSGKWVLGARYGDVSEWGPIPVVGLKDQVLFAWPGWLGCLVIAVGDFRQTATAYRWFMVPAWSLVAASAVLPATRLFLACRRADRQSRRVVCLNCGYDLRATPGRCPECGAEAAARTGNGARPTS